MPTYEYRCASCEKHIEVVQSFADDPLTECPSCAGPLRKVFAPVGIVFKGSGFYKTDNRSGKRSGEGSKRDKETGSSSSGSSSSGSSEGSADSSSSSKSAESKIA